MPRRKPPLDADSLHFARKLRRNSTDAERLLWGQLRNRRFMGLKFRRQHPMPPYALDFYCEALSLAIELDGGQHNSDEGRRYDEVRSATLAAQGIRVLRFWNHHVLDDLEAVLNAIVREVETLRSPLPPGEG